MNSASREVEPMSGNFTLNQQQRGSDISRLHNIASEVVSNISGSMAPDGSNHLVSKHFMLI